MSMCRGSPREQSPQQSRSTAPGDHMIGGPDGAMLLVPIISRGLEMSADAALVVAEHQRISEPCMKSAMAVIWSLPSIVFTREKTRSDAAEEGAIAKMMRAAFAQVGKRGLYAR